MGIYDRDYYDERPTGVQLSGPKTVVTKLILVNVAVFLVDQLFLNKSLNAQVALHSNLFVEPWNCWQLLTHGFVHDDGGVTHILFNMLTLWFFGRDIERHYGAAEFLRLYLTMIVVAGLVWAAAEHFEHPQGVSTAVGASGAVIGVLILFILRNPHATLLLFFVIPMPAWVLGAVVIGMDLLLALNVTIAQQVLHVEGNIAWQAHLAGAAFAFLYYRFHWNLGRVLPRGLSLKRLRGPRLRVHDPDLRQRDLDRQVDRILAKISRQGEESLTKKERRTLEEASRRAQRKLRD